VSQGVKSYYARGNDTVPEGMVRSLQFTCGQGRFWNGEVLREARPSAFSKLSRRFYTKKERDIWTWYWVNFREYGTYLCPEVDIAPDLLNAYTKHCHKRKRSVILSKTVKVKKGKRTKRHIKKDISEQKDKVQTEPQLVSVSETQITKRVFDAFASRTQNFHFIFLSDSHESNTLSSFLSSSWSTLPRRVYVANPAGNNTKELVLVPPGLLLQVHVMNESAYQFFTETLPSSDLADADHKVMKFSAIWLHDACQDDRQWSKLLQPILESHLVDRCVLAVTLHNKNGGKVFERALNMINLVSLLVEETKRYCFEKIQTLLTQSSAVTLVFCLQSKRSQI
jgi:hypothetical protein